MTLFKLTDFISSRRSSHIINNTLLRAYPTLLYMVWTVLIVAIIMSSILFLTERGSYTVNQDYPEGAFLRPNYLNTVKEESPFKSVFISIYYVLVTMTSTGYGDLYCTSSLGRSLSNLLMCSAVFILALPIAVLGNILSEEVDKYLRKKEERNETVRKQLKKGKKFPIFKYRAGPSFRETFRRLSSFSTANVVLTGKNSLLKGKKYLNDSPTTSREQLLTTMNRSPVSIKSRQRNSANLTGGGGGGGGGGGNKRGSDRLVISHSTLETVKRLSANSQVLFVENVMTYERPFQDVQEKTKGTESGDSDEDDDLVDQGIVLNPMVSKPSPIRRVSSLTKIFHSPSSLPLVEENRQSSISLSPSPPHSSSPTLSSSSLPPRSPFSSPLLSPSRPSMTNLQFQLRDIEQQIDHYSQIYQDRLKECLDIYQQIQIQMRIRNELLTSLATTTANDTPTTLTPTAATTTNQIEGGEVVI
jgi:hypothetical protein